MFLKVNKCHLFVCGTVVDIGFDFLLFQLNEQFALTIA